MLSQTAQYALRAVVILASQKNSPMTVTQLAQYTKVPEKYLAKVMQALVRADIVSSRPGKSGGFSLKISLEKLNLRIIIDAIDSTSDDDFPMGLQSYGSPLHRLYQKLKSLNASVRNECAHIFIKDLI